MTYFCGNSALSERRRATLDYTTTIYERCFVLIFTKLGSSSQLHLVFLSTTESCSSPKTHHPHHGRFARESFILPEGWADEHNQAEDCDSQCTGAGDRKFRAGPAFVLLDTDCSNCCDYFYLILQKMTEKCFKKCVGKPGQDLDGSEQVRVGGACRPAWCNCLTCVLSVFIDVCLQKCIAMCMDRFMDSWNVVSRALTQRLQQEQYKG